jgi:uncharacterized small protein (DUF1192 family)
LTNWYLALENSAGVLDTIAEEATRIATLKQSLDALVTQLENKNTAARRLSTYYLSGFGPSLYYSSSVSGSYTYRVSTLESRIATLTSNISRAESYISEKKREEQEEQDRRDEESNSGGGFSGDSDAGL